MAEFAQWGETISQCMGNPKMAFTNAFKANRRLQAIQVIETSPVAMVLNEMMEGLIDDYQRGRTTIDSQKHFDEYIKPEENTWTWRGSPTDLLRQLTIQALNMGVNTKNKMWPGAPHVLSRRLTEVRATLKEIGIDIGFKTDVGREKRREINIVKIASPASPASPSKNPAQKGGKSGDATKEGDATSVSGKQVASLKMVKNEHENEGRDARDARDATFANNIYPSDTNTDNIEDTD